jgi:surface protein
MSSNHELVPAATADLHLRKHAIFAASIVLAMVLGLIVFTSNPSRKKGREEEVFLFRRTLRSKGGSASTSDTPTASPSDTPTASPSDTPTVSPTTASPTPAPKCFDTRNELGDAVEIFMRNETEAVSLLNEKYGHPIGTWCFSEFLKDISTVFADASTFNEDISRWDVSKITKMLGVFIRAASFNQDLTLWNTSSVENLSYMFSGATSFNADLAGWDVSKVSTMKFMFQTASAFNRNLSSWDTSSVGDMEGLFYEASSFNNDIADWEVSKVSTTSNMFFKAHSFNQSLCPWGTKLMNQPNVVGMFFQATTCPNIENNGTPNLTAIPPGPFCYACN